MLESPRSVVPSGPATVRVPMPGALGRGEGVLVLVLFGALLALRAFYAARLPFDTDESQHLHVAWAWSKGHVAYRDFFDNHTPLFHLLSAPFVAAVGERAEILVLARYAMLPLHAATLYLTYAIGRRLFGARIGAWAAVLLGFHREFFAISIQYRTDQLWLLAWLLAVAVLLGGRWSARRGFAGGLLLGFAVGVSMKTLLSAGTLGAGALVAVAVCPAARAGWSARRAAMGAAAVFAGTLVVPGALALWLASMGALDAFRYCTLDHNAMSLGVGGWRPLSPYLFAAALAGSIGATFAFGRSRLAPGDRARQLTFLTSAGLCASIVFTIWPTSTRQDGLPLSVVLALLVAVVLVAALDAAIARLLPRLSLVAARRLAAGSLVLVVFGFGARLYAKSGFGRDLGPYIGELREVLRITDPSDFVMDAKGDTIFRERPFYYVLELFTIHRLEDGSIEDRIVERCVETGACVLYGEFKPFPRKTLARLLDHAVGVGRLRVQGHAFGTVTAGTPLPFDILVPSTYAFVAEDGIARGTLDGTPYEGPRALSAGAHVFVADVPARGLAVVWAKAAARGFAPTASAPLGP